MALITCKECTAEISSEAVTCPKCGVRNKPASKAWMLLLGLVAVFIWLANTDYVNTPQSKAKYEDRRRIEYCLSQVAGPPVGVNRIVKLTCEKLQADFRAKYNTEP